MTTTKAEELAARLESGWCPIESPADMERAAAELSCLSAENTAAVSAFLAADDERRELRTERDALLETFAKVCARLNIDTEAARKQPGKPSDVLIGAIDAEQDALKVALECERMRVVACGVVACSDTPKSAAVARDMLPVYRSASCDDVARRVDECISLRAERDALLAARTSPVHGWTDADADAGRLALELECILTDRDTPMPLTSRWWESAHEALALHRKRLAEEQAALRELECPPDPETVDRALAQARRMERLTDGQLSALLKEARKIIRASSSRSLAKDWDRRATQALAGATTGEQR